MHETSLDITQEKIEVLKQILPEAFSEGKIDWEKLKATLGENINFSNERYVLNWAGKSDAFKILQTPTTKTLVPAKDKSVNFDTTKNIFIEGENLEVLKVLQKSYFGKVKMIYIDPPYNTGNDSFIYPDKFSETKAEYEKRVGDKDEDGYMTKDGMFKKNSKENGQYHSNWLNMMMPRLYLAKNLLRQDGVIFVSIDDNEVHNLRLLMNEVFGEENFVGELIWQKKKGGSNDSKYIAIEHETVLFFSKNLSEVPNLYHSYGEEYSKRYKEIDEFGRFFWDTFKRKSGKQYYSIICPDDTVLDKDEFGNPISWLRSENRFLEDMKKGEARIIKINNNWSVQFKQRMPDGKKPRSLLLEYGTTSEGSTELLNLFEKNLFDNPKPSMLIKHLISFGAIDKNSIILDFFAGSGTTAHAVMELNKDGGNRKYICVQLPELCDEKSEAHKAGYKTIAEISKERIRRAGEKIKTENEAEIKKLQSEIQTEETQTKIESLQNQDLGFKVLKLENSNFKQWQQIEGKDVQALEEQMKLFIDPVSANATVENMVYELLLKSGKDLNSKIEKKNSFYIVNNNELVLMLEKADQGIIDTALALKPVKVIVLDRLFQGNDQLKTNTVLQMKDAGVEFKTI